MVIHIKKKIHQFPQLKKLKILKNISKYLYLMTYIIFDPNQL